MTPIIIKFLYTVSPIHREKINSAIAAELLGVEVKTASRLLSKAEKLEILKGDGKTKNKVYSVL